MSRFFVVFACAAALSGCVSSSSEDIQGPSGATVHQAKCTGNSNGCLKTASQICKGPYQVLDSSSNAGGVIADIMPGPVTWYRMSFQCGKSDGRMPTFAFRGQSYRPPPVVYSQPSAPTVTNCSTYAGSVTCRSY